MIQKKAAIIIIGNEILSGRTQDTNVKFLAERLSEKGIKLQEVRVIPDDETTIIKTVNEIRARFDYVFTTGGIGPTHDDITAASIAKAFSVELKVNPKAKEMLLNRYGAENLTQERLKMAEVPVGASLIENRLTAAPGFIMGNVYVMAGVPAIARAMFEEAEKTIEASARIIKRSLFIMIPESKIARGFASLQKKYPNLEMGSYPYMNDNNQWGVELSLRGVSMNQIEQAYLELYDFVLNFGVEIKEQVAA